MRKLLFVLALSVLAMGVSAQKLVGNVGQMRGQKEVNLVIDFTGVTVSGKSEESYIENETKAKTDEEKEKWLKGWNEDLRTRAYAKFASEFNKFINDEFYKIGDFPSAEYTINLKVINIVPGHFAGPVSKSPVLTTKVTFVKKGEETPFGTMDYKKMTAVIYEIPVLSERVANAFGTHGMQLARGLNSYLKK